MTTPSGAPPAQATPASVAVIGGGPAGLMAAEVLARGGARVSVFDAKPSVGRKFLLAGKGGLNLTHGEGFDAFVARFGAAAGSIDPLLRRFGPTDVRAWAGSLGIRTFIGTSGRVFPVDLKAAPLLRAWLHRLRAEGVAFHMRHRWSGWGAAGAPVAAVDHRFGASLCFSTPTGELEVSPDAVVFALGGASWPQLGSNGAWVPLLEGRGVSVAPLQPSNCGFDVAGGSASGATPAPGWTQLFRTRFAGSPLKNVALSLTGDAAPGAPRIGEFVVTDTGVEGSLVYALSAAARERIERDGRAVLQLDLLPARSAGFVLAETTRPRGARSLSTHLKSRLGLDGVKSALLHELLPREALADPHRLAAAIKSLPLTLTAARPIAEAISSAGGVRFDALDARLMSTALPGVFCCGEMLDWEAPTGGYLLTAGMASAVVAAEGALGWLGASRGGASDGTTPTR